MSPPSHLPRAGDTAQTNDNASLLCAAVKSVLEAANVPVSLEQKLLLERNLELQTQLEAARAELSIAITEGRSAVQKLEEFTEANTCQICLARRVDALMSPCGHLICRQCVPRCSGRCPFCRGDIEGTHNFYAPSS